MESSYVVCMPAALRTARVGILEQVREPLPGARFAESAMNAFAGAVGFDGYCMFAVDPLTGLRTMMFGRNGLRVPTARLVHNETIEHDVNRYADLISSRSKGGDPGAGRTIRAQEPSVARNPPP